VFLFFNLKLVLSKTPLEPFIYWGFVDFIVSGKLRDEPQWVYPPKDNFTGQTIQDNSYFKFLKELEKQGFDIQLHNVGSGKFNRNEIIEGLDIFKHKFGRYPKLHINHASNPDNLYWGYKRYGIIFRKIIQLLKGKKKRFYGDEVGSEYFWGDLAKNKIKFIRNRVFNGVDTLKYDPQMPFKEKYKKFSNYWFSSSDGHTIEEFNNLISKSNINKLKRENGLCLVYTHFASGFVDDDNNLNEQFKENIDYLSEQNGWFVPASEILEYLLSEKKEDFVSELYLSKLDIKWLTNRIMKKIRYRR
tara:strand:- start:2169 stop:3074 length:906 start_codon:yes stop_codon:yes gene_type:complete